MKILKQLGLSALIFFGLASVAYAVQVTVPSAPGANYVLLSTSNGNYTAVATSSLGISGGGGTVTSVGVSSSNSTLTIGSSPVTTSGTITADINLTNANVWTGGQTFGNTTTTNATTTNLYLPNITSSFLAVNAQHQIIATTTPSGGSGTVTSVGASLTGVTYTGSPVTTSGTLAGTFSSGFSDRKLPTFTVGASGADYTTIQAALNACGTNGGGLIYLTDASYTLASTLTWAGSDCILEGNGTTGTTINVPGNTVTTAIKTGSASSDYDSDEILNVYFNQTNGTPQGTAIDASNMSHNTYKNITMDNFGTFIQMNDTQNITFYNSFYDILGQIYTGTPNAKTYGVNASSTDPTNDNNFYNVKFSLEADNSTNPSYCVNINNGQSNNFYGLNCEPNDAGTNDYGIYLSSVGNTAGTNNGTFDNDFFGYYEESNLKGSYVVTGAASPLVMNNMIDGAQMPDPIVDTANSYTTFVGVDNSLSTPYTTSFPDLAIGTSSNSTPNQLKVVNSTSGTAAQTSILAQDYTNFAYTATGGLVNFKLLNSSDTGPVLRIDDAGTGAAIYVASGKVGIGSSTPAAYLTNIAASSSAAISWGTILGGLENTVTKWFLAIDQWGHEVTSGDAPSVAGGTSSVVGNDNNGTITVTGTALTSVTLTFAHAWPTAPDCTESDNSTAITGDITSISTTQVVFGFSAGVSSGTVWYICRGFQ